MPSKITIIDGISQGVFSCSLIMEQSFLGLFDNET